MLLSKLLKFLVLSILLVFSQRIAGVYGSRPKNDINITTLAGIELPDHMSFNAVVSSTNTGCSYSRQERIATRDEEDGLRFLGETGDEKTVKLHLKRRSPVNQEPLVHSTARDLARIQTLHKRIIEKKNQNAVSRLLKDKKTGQYGSPVAVTPAPESSPAMEVMMMATLESGVSLGSGEYFMDVFIGTPPRHFSLILDTGSDLNWIQCVPCHDCFEQSGPFYDPKMSSSYKDISCEDPRCHLVSSPDPPMPCKKNQTCPYFYWYGDSSNTTGDFALETFTVNLTSVPGKSEFRRVENIMFGCGHWNRGLFHGAAGLLGLGRGPLSFSSQLQSLYGHSFSYCLVDRNSDTSVSSKLIFGEDKGLLGHPELNFTSFVAGKENPVDTFYYVEIKSILVGEEVLKIPEETWRLSSNASGGTIVDSGTTLSYFADPAYKIIKDAFMRKVKNYALVKDFPILEPCYNVSGVDKLELPKFGIQFADGAVWNFPVQNYFIRLEPEQVVCLAILGTPRSALSIIGNYQQQNFHILYDTKNSRLGYAPMNCAEI